VVTKSVWTNERTSVADGQPENIMPSPTLSGVEGIKVGRESPRIYGKFSY